MHRFAAALAGLMVAGLTSFPAPAAAAAEAFASDRIQVTVVGSGPDVILVPGLSSSPDRAWKSTVAAVPGHRYHLIQVKGFAGVAAEANASGPVSAPVADEIARYAKLQKLKRPALVGHSMGGTIGMMVAARHPDLLGRLMVVDMVPFTGAMFGQPNATVETMKPMAEQIRKAMSGPPNPQGEAMLTQMINGMVRTEAARPAILADSKASDRAATANAYYELLTTDLRPELGKVKVPLTVLYVTPTGAPVTDAQVDAMYKASYANASGAKLVRVPDAAHFLQVDNPARVQAELKAFLKQ
jgi:pimeloyl-ACP methyl ester carboxylesterase